MDKFTEYTSAVDEYFGKNQPWCRYGQACFNVLSEMHSELAESIRASSIDPYYKKSTELDQFFFFVKENLDAT